jgi:hypothetical protein
VSLLKNGNLQVKKFSSPKLVLAINILNVKIIVFCNMLPCSLVDCVKWVPVTTAWRVLGLRMEERPPGMKGSCEYIE